MILNGFIQRNDTLFDFNARHRDEPVSGIFTVILETPVLVTHPAQTRVPPDVVAPVFVKFRVQPIFFPEGHRPDEVQHRNMPLRPNPGTEWF